MNLKMFFLMLAVASATIASAATATVTSVRQNWPWDTKVKIGYTLAAESGKYDLTVKVKQGVDVWTLSDRALSGDRYGVTAGQHEMVWNPAHDDVTNFTALVNATFIVEPEENVSVMQEYLIVDLSAGSTADAWPVTAATSVDVADEAYKTTKLLFRRVRPRQFLLSSPLDEPLRKNAYEGSSGQYATTLTNDYYVCVYEMTQEQYRLMTGTEGKAGEGGAYPRYGFLWTDIRGPNVGILWPASSDVDADSLIGKLRTKAVLAETVVPAGWKFDLPTDAQWENACRAGLNTPWNNGTSVNIYTNTAGNVCDDNLDKLGWYSGNAGGKVHKVGLKEPNSLGLYDMHGNVWEWTLCALHYSSNPEGGTEPTGYGYGTKYGSNANGNSYRSIRGGCYKISDGGGAAYKWNVAEDGVAGCRAAGRSRSYDAGYDCVGCRLAIRYSLNNAGHDLEKYPPEQYPYK